ncbi:MAG TPA: malonic semialdehyde reductase [Paracoccaceae bacterium]|nr:malonic semialdehyde reductase [Paracoccaceae bacterium]
MAVGDGVGEAALDALFGTHTAHGWLDRPVPRGLIRRMVDLAGMGPTAFNQQPLRLILVDSAGAKARLSPALSGANRAKTMAAPVTAILCHDRGFWRHLPEVWPAQDVRGYFDGQPQAAAESARRNGTLQAGYLIMAARALGLGAGPMSGFDRAKVAAAFTADRQEWEVDMLVNIGWADPAAFRPRNPRLGFDRMAAFV